MKNKLNSQSELVSNQQFMLLFRGQNILCSNLDVTKQPQLIQPLHVLLIDQFRKQKNILKAVKRFVQSEQTRTLMGNIPDNVVLSRIGELYSHDIIEEAGSNISSDFHGKPKALDTSESSVEPIRGNYKLHRNLALRFSSDGFVAQFSNKDNQYLLSINQLFTLLAVSSATAIEGSIQFKAPNISSDEHWRCVQSLIRVGLLQEKSERKPEVNTEKPGDKTEIKDAQYPEREQNKIPVYFVPHTENHYPLALGLLHTAISDYKAGALLDKYQLIPIVYQTGENFISGPYKKYGPGIWLFSNYLWSVESNLSLSQYVKQSSQRNLTIHGGPSTPDYPEASKDFFATNPSVDISVHAEGEVALCEILEALSITEQGAQYKPEALAEIDGISYRNNFQGANVIEHTASRTRMSDPDCIPSPYMNKVFEQYAPDVEAAIIETNRGCPFGCTFCDWGSAINQKVRRFDMDRIKKEIEWIAKRQTKVIWIADANFGMLDRDVEVADFIIEMKKQYGFPQEVVVNYTKNTTTRLVDIIKIFTEGGIISQGVISIQTMDEQTLEVIDRKNIKLNKYEELRQIFSDLKLPLSTDLMLGLPGTNMDALKNDLQHYIDADVAVKAYPTQLLPNSPMADPDYIEKYQIETDENDYLKSTYSYTEEELSDMKLLYKIFTMADGYGLLRYVIRYLQWEYQIRAIDFIHDLMQSLQAEPSQYPRLAFAMRFFETDKCVPGGWDAYYDELHQYVINNYEIADDTALASIIKMNEAVMPDESKDYPRTVSLQHDVISYFTHKSNGREASLLDTSESEVVVSDPDGMVDIDDTYLQYDSHQFFWELTSEVSRIRSAFTI